MLGWLTYSAWGVAVAVRDMLYSSVFQFYDKEDEALQTRLCLSVIAAE